MTVKVKICGITNAKDAICAVDAGADALGFMFFEESTRNIAPSRAAEIMRDLPAFVAKVGVFVNASHDRVRSIIEECALDTLQFHGDETPEFCRQFRLKAIKAFRVQDEDSLQQLAAYRLETWLLDSFVPGRAGGTGTAFNWDLAAAATRMGSRVILAGGLTPENVSKAIEHVHPFAVDVSSGVEATQGKKDPQKIRDFIRAAKWS